MSLCNVVTMLEMSTTQLEGGSKSRISRYTSSRDSKPGGEEFGTGMFDCSNVHVQFVLASTFPLGRTDFLSFSGPYYQDAVIREGKHISMIPKEL